MAEVPKYTTRVGAPGPVPWFEGGRPMRDVGLAVLAQETGQLADKFEKWDQERTDAYESAEITGRVSKFALGADEALTAALKLPYEQQDDAFNDAIERLREQTMDWTQGSTEGKTKLGNAILDQYTSTLISYRRARRRQEIQQIDQNAELGWETALRTGSFALAQDAAENKTRIGVWSEQFANEQLEQFQTSSDIQRTESLLLGDPNALNPQAAMTEMEQILARRDITQQQRERAQEVYARAAKMQDAIQRSRDDNRFETLSAALENGTLTGQMIGNTYDPTEETSQTRREEVENTRKLFSHFLSQSFTDEAPVNWDAYLEAERTVMDYWQGKVSKNEAHMELLKTRYGDGEKRSPSLGDEEYRALRKMLDTEYPAHLTFSIQEAFDAADRQLSRGLFGSIDDERAARVHGAILAEIEARRAGGKPLSTKEIYDIAVEKTAVSKPRQIIPGSGVSIGIPNRPIVRDMADMPEPETVDAFMREVGRLKATNPEKARTYYDKWKDKWQSP